MSLVRASTTSLEVSWSATPATNTYILEIQKLPPTASPSPVSTPTPVLSVGTPVAATIAGGSPVTMVNNAGNVYRLQKPGGAIQAQQPLRVLGSPMAAAVGAKLGTTLTKSPAVGGQVVSVVKGAQFVQGMSQKVGGITAAGAIQRTATIGGIKQITSTGSLIQQAGGQGGNIVTMSPQQASNLVGQKIVLQKSTLQQFQQQSPGGQKVSVLPAGTTVGAGGGPQIVKLVKTAQGMQVQGAGGAKVVNPATGKIIQMATGQQFFTINKSSGAVTSSAGGVVGGQQMQKRIITTGPGGQEQQIIVVSQSPSSSIQIRPTSTVIGQTNAGVAGGAGTRGPIKIQTVTGGTKQFTIGGKPVTVQLGGVGKKALTIMGGGGAAGAATSGSIINAQGGVAGGQGGQQILILPSGQGQIMHQAGGVLKPGSVLQQGARKSYIQIVGGTGGAQQTVGGQKVLPRIVINQSQLQGGQGGGGASGSGANSGNIEQVDGMVDGEWVGMG